MLDNDDKKTIDKISFEQVFQAMQDIILPRFDEVNQKFDEVNRRIDGLKDEVGGLKEDVTDLKTMSETIDDDMTGIKMRLSSVEKKVDVLIDSSIEVKLLKNRVTRLEEAIL